MFSSYCLVDVLCIISMGVYLDWVHRLYPLYQIAFHKIIDLHWFNILKMLLSLSG